MDNRSRYQIKKPVLAVFFLVLAGIAAGAAFKRYATMDSIRYAILSMGVFSYLVFFLGCALRSMVLLPCGIFSVLGGMLFGPVKGAAVTVAGFTASALFPFFMSRKMGRDWAGRYFSRQLQSVDRHMSRNGFLNVFLMRVIPVLPFDAVSCIGGISKVPLKDFLIATFLGSVPGVFVYNFFGDSLETANYKKILLSVGLVSAFALAPVLYKLVQKLLQKRHIKAAGSKCPN